MQQKTINNKSNDDTLAQDFQERIEQMNVHSGLVDPGAPPMSWGTKPQKMKEAMKSKLFQKNRTINNNTNEIITYYIENLKIIKIHNKNTKLAMFSASFRSSCACSTKK